MVTCKICGKEFRSITNTHLLHQHGITVDEYARLYGGQLVSDETRMQLSRSNRGKKHPGIYDGFDWSVTELGTKPDSVIAREFNIPTSTVGITRRRKGIPAFVGIILTQEGDPCRSIYEAMYDAYLHWKNQAHEHEVRVGNLPYIADFKVGDCFVEIAGMAQFAKYARKLEQKRQAYQDAHVKVIWLSTQEIEELYAECPVEVKFRVERRCERCGKQTHDLVKNVCRKCYMHVWREDNQNKVICEQCGCEFTPMIDRPNQKYCSHECYSKSLELDWPSWEWIAEQMKTTSIRQIAFRIGVKASSLYMRIRRRKERNRGKLV